MKLALGWLPHLLTLIRLVSSPVLAWLIVELRFREALALVLLAGVTDWLDGFSARQLGVTGNVGMVFDPLADKAMLTTLFVTLAYVHLIPIWLSILVIGRDAVIVAGALLLRIFRSVRRFLPSRLGKISTFFQIALVLLVLLRAAFADSIFVPLARAAIGLGAVFTIASGADYVRNGLRMACRVPSTRQTLARRQG